MIYDIFRGSIGIIGLLTICFLLSNNKKKIDWRLVGIGMLMQIVFALLMLKVAWVNGLFSFVVDFFKVMLSASDESALFLFGDLAKIGGPFGFAFTVLPTIIFFSVISSALYYLGILQKVVYIFAWIMKKTMRLSGAESLAAAANVFIGQTEAPLIVKPYLDKMTKSEIMCLMTGGMATIAGGVFAAYMQMLGGNDEYSLSLFGMHLLTASVISAPAAIVSAKILFPEEQTDQINENLSLPSSDLGSNLLDALSKGTTDGLKLAVNVGAMLLTFMAIIFLLNKIFFFIGDITNLNDLITSWTNGTYTSLTLQYVFGLLFSPVAWLIGIESKDIIAIGQLLGEKTILNEFVAYASLQNLIGANVLSEKSIIIATYALCGFANFASIGIQIGGIGTIAPSQRAKLTKLGIKALIGGTVASLLTGAIVGMLY